jgi:PEP-CTERM motif-containing protein
MRIAAYSSWFAAAGLLAIVVAAPSAIAFVQAGHLAPLTIASGNPVTMAGAERAQPMSSSLTRSPMGPPMGIREPVAAPASEATTSPVPEPGTLALTSLGLLALGVARRRWRGLRTSTSPTIR